MSQKYARNKVTRLKQTKCKICAESVPVEDRISFRAMFNDNGDDTVLAALAAFASVQIVHDDGEDDFLCTMGCYKTLVKGLTLQERIRSIFKVNFDLPEEANIRDDECSESRQEEVEMLDYNVYVDNQDPKASASTESLLDIEILPTEVEDVSLDDVAGQPFVFPDASLISTHMKFQNFDYLELKGGVRCCGCEFIAANPSELTLHTMDCHRQTVEAENDRAIVCEICCNPFQTNQELRIHQKCVSGKDIFLCKSCMVCFNTKEKLMRHMSICAELNQDDRQDDDDDAFAEPVDLNSELKSTKPLEPVDANKRVAIMLDEKFVTRREEYDEYQILHTDAKRCCCCGAFFASYDAVMAHVREACPRSNGATEDATVCTVCGVRFKSQKALKYHKGTNERINKIYYCKLCDLSFVRYFHLARHFHASLKHSAIGDGIVGKDGDRVMVALLKKLGSSVQPSRFEHVCCFLRCEASFDRRQDLLEHVENLHAPRRRIHMRERTCQRHVCAICQLGFGSEQNLHRHLYQRYLKKTSICSFCGKGFKRPTLLRQHEQVEHTDTAPQFECALCGKKFKKQSLLKLHLVTHEAERKFSCEHCSSQFHFRHQLKKHQQAVHATEFPYECSFCDRKMPNKNSYDLHLRTHTGEKPFVCRHGCCRAFSHSTDRRRHEMVAHTDEKPHRCAVCQTAYVRRRQLMQHFQRYPEHNTEAEYSSPAHDEVAED